MSVIPSVAVDLCGRLRPSFHPAACSACSPSMSWERKLLHCGPYADRRDLLAHYLFISVLHRWLPKGSDHAWSLDAQAACGGQGPGRGSQMDACMLLETHLATYRSLGCQEVPCSQCIVCVIHIILTFFVLSRVNSIESFE